MKIYKFFALSMMLVLPAFSQEKAPAKVDPKKQEMMQKWMEFSTPGEAHKVLSPMVGKWTYTSKWWEMPNEKPTESKGTSTIKFILGGRFLEHRAKGMAMGMPFEGMGLTGYDNLKKKYESIWTDNMSTAIMHGSGDFNAQTKTLTDSGTASCPMTESKTRPYRSEWAIVNNNQLSFKMWGPDESGKEFLQLEMLYKRAK